MLIESRKSENMDYFRLRIKIITYFDLGLIQSYSKSGCGRIKIINYFNILKYFYNITVSLHTYPDTF